MQRAANVNDSHKAFNFNPTGTPYGTSIGCHSIGQPARQPGFRLSLREWLNVSISQLRDQLPPVRL